MIVDAKNNRIGFEIYEDNLTDKTNFGPVCLYWHPMQGTILIEDL